MAIYRTVNLSFWSDSKIADDFTPEDRYFYLYLLTNTHTNLCGCYEISYKQMARETGYNEETVKRLIDRMQAIHDVLIYKEETREVLIWNWYKYNWNKSDKVIQGVRKNACKIKSDELKNIILNITNCIENDVEFDRVSIGYTYPMHTSVTVTDTNNINNTNKSNINNKRIIKNNIIDYLNNKLGTKYTYKGIKTNSVLDARLSEGFKKKDFETVIDAKFDEWAKDETMSKYLRPETLFGTKFESYLNQARKQESKSEYADAINRIKERQNEHLSSISTDDDIKAMGLF